MIYQQGKFNILEIISKEPYFIFKKALNDGEPTYYTDVQIVLSMKIDRNELFIKDTNKIFSEKNLQIILLKKQQGILQSKPSEAWFSDFLWVNFQGVLINNEKFCFIF